MMILRRVLGRRACGELSKIWGATEHPEYHRFCDSVRSETVRLKSWKNGADNGEVSHLVLHWHFI
jgi:hypothetical protein